MTAAAPSVYQVVRGDVHADRTRVIQAWSACGLRVDPPERSGGLFDWFYLQGPAGPADVFFLVHVPSGATVGVLGLARRELWYRGKRVTAGALIDFVVHPAHRVFYPAALLHRTAREWGLEHHAALFGLPNPHAIGVMRRAGEYAEFESARFVRILDFRSFLSRYAPRAVATVEGAVFNAVARLIEAFPPAIRRTARTRWVTEFDSRYDALWSRLTATHEAIGRRDCAFLTWRYLMHPGTPIRILEVIAADSDELLAYFVCTADAAGFMSVLDFAVGPDPASRRDAFRALVRAARRAGAKRISLVAIRSQSLARTLRAAGLVERESCAMLIGSRPGDMAALRTADWHMTAADLDG